MKLVICCSFCEVLDKWWLWFWLLVLWFGCWVVLGRLWNCLVVVSRGLLGVIGIVFCWFSSFFFVWCSCWLDLVEWCFVVGMIVWCWLFSCLLGSWCWYWLCDDFLEIGRLFCLLSLVRFVGICCGMWLCRSWDLGLF